MIIPFFGNCNIASSLSNLKLRKCAYPFDWIITDFATVVDLFTILINISDSDLNALVDKMFDLESQHIATMSWSGEKFLISSGTPYVGKCTPGVDRCIQFPHDELSGIKEKYHRRFKRLRDNYNLAVSVTLIISGISIPTSFEDIKLLESRTDGKVKIVFITPLYGNELNTDRISIYNVSLTLDPIDPIDNFTYEQLKQQNPRAPLNNVVEQVILMKALSLAI